MPELVFVAPGDGAAAGLVAALAAEVDRQDAVATVLADPPPPREDRVYVVFQGAEDGPTPAPTAPARTIAVLLGSPAGPHFEEGVELARAVGFPFHVNSVARERLLELGVPARHLQLGYAASWDSGEPAADPELVVIDNGGGYFDWLRYLEVVHAGGVALHEHSLGQSPLVAGRHLFVASPSALPAVATALGEDRPRLREVRGEARDFLAAALPMALAAAALVGAARALVAQPLATAAS